MALITEHFDEIEVQCRCGCGNSNVSPRLMAALEKFRLFLGRPILINSAVRCARHNQLVGGALGSLHVPDPKTGVSLAVDIRVKNMSAFDLMERLEEFNREPLCICSGYKIFRDGEKAGLYYPPLTFTGRGIYPGENFIHLDIRRNGLGEHISRWFKRSGIYEYVSQF